MPHKFVAMPTDIAGAQDRDKDARYRMRQMSLAGSHYFLPEDYLEVEVRDPRTHGTTRSLYTDYEIVVKSNLPFFKPESSVRRRYSDFEAFRELLKADLEKVNVAPLPGKVFTNRFSAEVISARMEGLNHFIRNVASHPLVQTSKTQRLLTSFLQDPEWNKEEWLYP